MYTLHTSIYLQSNTDSLNSVGWGGGGNWMCMSKISLFVQLLIVSIADLDSRLLTLFNQWLGSIVARLTCYSNIIIKF